MITTINEFRKHQLNMINEMSYASLQGEIDALKAQLAQLFQDQETEAGQKGDAWTDEDANRYGAEMNKIERKIETRQKYIDRLRAGRKGSSQTLNVGDKITYNGVEHTIVANNGNEVKLANTSDTTYQGKPIRVTHVEGSKVFVNTWKESGGFNNFAKGINIDEIENLIVVPVAEFTKTREPRQPKDRQPKPDRERVLAIRNIIKVLNKNIDSVKPSIDKFKDRTPEEQATIFKSRFRMNDSIEMIVAALKEMGLVQ